MARKGDIVEHPVTGERITFLETSKETDGEYALFELRVRPHGFVAAPHIHPLAEESFEIRSGTFAFVVNGEERWVRAGEQATVPAGAPHAWWNAGEDEGVAIVEFRPGFKTEEFFESFFGLAQDGKVSPKTGLPNVLWLAAIFRSYQDFGYVAKPPLFLQRAVSAPLGAVARLLGYRLPHPYPYAQRSGARGVRGGRNVGDSARADTNGIRPQGKHEPRSATALRSLLARAPSSRRGATLETRRSAAATTSDLATTAPSLTWAPPATRTAWASGVQRA